MIIRIKREIVSADEFGENLGKLPVILQGIVLTMYANEPEMRKKAKEHGNKGIKALEQMKEMERILQKIPSEVREKYDIRTREQLEEIVFTKVTEFEVTKEIFEELCRVFKIYNVAFKTMTHGIEIDLRQEQRK
ncbi:MAG: hypothetical protein IBV52_00805 [Candidatus Bathyarchaeota archaeon]